MHCFIKSPVEVSALGRTSSSRKGPEARVMAVPAVSGRHSQRAGRKEAGPAMELFIGPGKVTQRLRVGWKSGET